MTGQFVRSVSRTDDDGYSPAVFPSKNQTLLCRLRLLRVDGRTGKSLSSIRWLVSCAIRFLCSDLPLVPLTCEIVRELRSLYGRIGTIYAAKLYQSGVSFGPLGNGQDSAQSRKTYACIRDMQRITNRYRWATTLDYSMMVESWKLGAEWQSSLDIPQSHTLSTDANPTVPSFTS
jgi:hypothetical protein